MSRSAIDDRWGGRHGALRLVLRLIGTSFFAYLLAAQGAFRGPWWVAAVAGFALALSYVLLLIRTWRPFDRLALGLCVLMMATGVVVNPWIGYLGSVFFVIGGVMLVGQPEVSIRRSAVVTGVLGAGLVLGALLTEPGWSVLLSTVLGVAATVLLGLNRRQRVIQLRQDQALALRSTELELRNAQLEEQTVRTRREAARVAALEERSRIARDLHDLLAHSLGGLVVQLEAAGAELEQGRTTEAARRVRDSRRLAVDGLREARSAVEQLRSDGGGGQHRVELVTALQRVLYGPVGMHLRAALDVVGSERLVPPDVAEALVATAREGLTNVNKHAPGAQVSATVVFGSDTVRLELVNGSSDDPSALADSGSGSGLRGLQERLRAAGGRLQSGPEGRRWVLAAECDLHDDGTEGEEWR